MEKNHLLVGIDLLMVLLRTWKKDYTYQFENLEDSLEI